MSRQKMILAGSPRHLELQKALGAAQRDFLLINISGTCNYNCKKCCNLVPNKRSQLSLKEIKGLVLAAKESLGIRSVVFIGEGETTLAPNFRKIISFVNKAGLYSIIFTNGYFIDEKLANFLSENNTSIIFSVDSLERQKYEYLTGAKNSFKRVMQNIQASRRIFAKKSRIEKGRKIVWLAINMLLIEKNIKEAGKFREFCANDILPVFNYPLMAGNAIDNSALFGKVTEKSKMLASPTNIPEKERKCGYFFHGITIGLDGSILACPYSLELTGKLENIKKERLESAVAAHDKMIAEFRKLDKKSYCLLRSPKYAEFLRRIGE